MNILNLDNVSKDFGGIRAVHEVSCSLAKGEVTAIIGPNGAGKSTLTCLVSGIYKPSAGRIVFDGQPIEELPAHQIKRLGIARTYQIVQLFSGLTVLENVLVGGHVKFERGWTGLLPGVGRAAAQEKSLVAECMAILAFLGIDQYAQSATGGLSFGHQRLVELARALVAQPTLLILDEPCSGLAPREIEQQLGIIADLRKRGVSVLFIEHNMSVVMDISDSIVVLNYGQKIAAGTPREVMNNPAVVEAYLGEELRDAIS